MKSQLNYYISKSSKAIATCIGRRQTKEMVKALDAKSPAVGHSKSEARHHLFFT
jgi:hypothetical protein